MFGRYFYVNDAHITFDYDRFYLKAGRTTQEDVIDSPYSLFVSSQPIPAVQVETSYNGSRFFYTSRWVNLNHNSDQIYFGSTAEDSYYGSEAEYLSEYEDGIPWLDRGANFKVYGLNLGDWRFGLQESAVYLNDSFNPEFFFSPMIMYFTQLIVNGGAKPWTEYANSKHVMGFFLDRKTSDTYLASQILVDDINASIIPGISAENQNRIAWSLGGNKDFKFGRLGFYHAGATKNAFGATSAHNPETKDLDEYEADQIPLYYSSRPYAYTYYPAVSYELEDGTVMPIDYRDNYIGYKYGENNIAFMVDYDNVFFRKKPGEFSLYSSLEWVLNGEKSPANPWHEYDKWKDIEDATSLLDGTIEHLVVFRNRVDKAVSIFGIPFSLFADLELGMAFNAIQLEPAGTEDDRDVQEPWIYRPQKGLNEPIFSLTLGAGYLWQL